MYLEGSDRQQQYQHQHEQASNGPPSARAVSLKAEAPGLRLQGPHRFFPTHAHTHTGQCLCLSIDDASGGAAMPDDVKDHHGGVFGGAVSRALDDAMTTTAGP